MSRSRWTNRWWWSGRVDVDGKLAWRRNAVQKVACVRTCRLICQRVEEDVVEEIIQPRRPRYDFRGRLVKHFRRG